MRTSDPKDTLVYCEMYAEICRRLGLSHKKLKKYHSNHISPTRFINLAKGKIHIRFLVDSRSDEHPMIEVSCWENSFTNHLKAENALISIHDPQLVNKIVRFINNKISKHNVRNKR